MHLERGPKICQNSFLRTCTSASSEEVLMNEWNGIYWYLCLLLKCTFVLLVDVELGRDKSILLKLMSRTYYQWYFYLLMISAYASSDMLFSVVYIWNPEYSVIIWHFYTVVTILFMLSVWITYYAICLSQLFRLFCYTKQFSFNGFFSRSNWIIFITDCCWKLF